MVIDAALAALLPLGLLLAALLGLAVGSLIATLALRWPRGETLAGRSRCDSCGAKLAARDLVPLLSFALLRGRCRACGARIDWRQPAIEAAAALLAMMAWAAAPGPAGVAGALFGWMLLAMAVLDAEHFWLPDRLTLPFLALGLALGLGDLPERLLGAGLGVGLMLLLRAGFQQLFHREGLGLGDVKLMGGLGAWLSWSSLPPLWLLASLVGLGAAMFRVVHARRTGGPVAAAPEPIPFGACLAVAAFPLWLLQSAGRW